MTFEEAKQLAFDVLSARQVGNCSWGRIKENDDHQSFVGAPCHLDAKSGWHPSYRYFYSTYGSYNFDTVDHSHVRMFHEFLFGPQSPWRLATQDRETALLEKDGLTYGFILELKPDDELGLLLNLCVASRWANEYQPQLGTWVKLVQLGVEPAEAYFIAAHFGVDSRGDLHRGGSVGSGHSIIDSYESNTYVFDLKRFIEGIPEIKQSRKLSSVTNCGSINDIFQSAKSKKIKHLSSWFKKPEETIRGRWCNIKKGITVEDVATDWTNKIRKEFLSITNLSV